MALSFRLALSISSLQSQCIALHATLMTMVAQEKGNAVKSKDATGLGRCRKYIFTKMWIRVRYGWVT